MPCIYLKANGNDHFKPGLKRSFMKPDMSVKLVKEPDNDVDKEAIKVEMPGVGLVGYVGNSPYTVIGESYSSGRLYDKIGDEARGKVLYVLSDGVICELDSESLI